MPCSDTDFFQPNSLKANFDDIYRRPDPREYFRVLGGLDYVIPDLAKAPFRAIADTVRRKRRRRLKIADVGCSYGINAALLRYPLDTGLLARRYLSTSMQEMRSEHLAELDSHYFRSWPMRNDDMVIGIDTAQPAIAYALRSGLIDGAVTTNLEEHDAATQEAHLLRGLNLVISTGCIGYTSEKTMRRILAMQSEKTPMPWVACLVLRMFRYDAIAEELARFGLVTEKLEGITFVQRRFHSEQEYAGTIQALEKMQIDPQGKESEGLLHAELYVSRPAAETDIRLTDVISVTSGEGRRYGGRYRKGAGGRIVLTH